MYRAGQWDCCSGPKTCVNSWAARALAAGQGILVQRDSFLCAQASVTLNIAFTKRLGAGFFGGEGFILEKLTGPGTAFATGLSERR